MKQGVSSKKLKSV